MNASNAELSEINLFNASVELHRIANHEDYKHRANILFYAVLLPIGLIGNTLSAIVVSYIAKNQRGKRSIPDILLGVLAVVDLFSIIFIHSISLVVLIRPDWSLPRGLCLYQSLAVGTYLKLEFLIQVIVSLDRYAALVKPLHYHSLSSVRKVRIAVAVVTAVSAGTSAVTVGALPSSVRQLTTWPLCMCEWETSYVPHLILLGVTCVIFVTGFAVFVFSNTTLVRILWTYQAQRASNFLKEINDAVNVMEQKDTSGEKKSRSLSRSERSNKDGGRSPLPSIRVQGDGGDADSQAPTPSVDNPEQCLDVVDSPLPRSPSKPVTIEENQSQVHSSSTGEDLAEVLSLTQTTVAGDSPKSVHNVETTTNTPEVPERNHLQVRVHVDSPSSSPELGGTPDSHCYLMNEPNKFSINNTNPGTLQVPGPEAAYPPNLSMRNGSIVSDGQTGESSSSHRNSTCANTTKKRVSINPTPTGEIPDIRSNVELDGSSRILSPITLQLPKMHEISLVSQDEKLNQFHSYAKKLLKKVGKKVERQRRELILAQLVILCATVFIATWMPYIVVVFLSWFGVDLGDIMKDIALKLIFSNACLNPIFYGICRNNYRKGYAYVTQMFIHYATCCLVKTPGEDRVFYESKRKNQQRQEDAAEMNNVMRMQTRRRRRAVSAHALQILQQTLNLQRVGSPGERSRSRSPMPDFTPSKGLQDLYERYVQLESAVSETSSSVDYEALAFMDLTEVDIYQNIQKVWSMCVINDDDVILSGFVNDVTDLDDDIELDVDYDAMVARDVDIGSDEVFCAAGGRSYQPCAQEQSDGSDIDIDLGDITLPLRLAMSTQTSALQRHLVKPKTSSL